MDGLWVRTGRLPKDTADRDGRVVAERSGACRGRGGVGMLAAVAAALAVFAVPGLWPPAALASSAPALNWTQHHPATSPPGRADASMAYDAATRTVVLFGGFDSHVQALGDTWTWDGSIWTRQHPATSPDARNGASMAYDRATGTVVLFGGVLSDGTGVYNDTWTWGSQ
jgi:hypothetical protein